MKTILVQNTSITISVYVGKVLIFWREQQKPSELHFRKYFPYFMQTKSRASAST